MPNKPRDIYPENLYHIYNRAVEKRIIFCIEKDYNRFLEKMFYYSEETKVKILAYSILPNHFHLLLQEPISQVENQIAISKFMSLLSNSYTKYFNCNKAHSGRIFQGPFKSKFVKNDSYLQTIIFYINLNPIKHKIVKDINDWYYTSHHELLNILSKKHKIIISENKFFSIEDYKDLIKDQIKIIKNINLEFD